jgi:hypothetical protein
MSHSIKNPRPDHESWEKIRKAVARQDYACSLALLPWEFFCTLTFPGNLPCIKICFGMAFAWVRDSADVFGVGRHQLLTALRSERGEATGRFHFHCLLGGTQSANRITDCHRLARVWQLVSGGGRVQIRPYSRLLAGPAYFVDDRAGANHYERGKFALAESVTLSRSCFVYLAKLTAISDRRRRQLTRKNGEVGKPGGIVAPAIRGPGTPWVEPLR